MISIAHSDLPAWVQAIGSIVAILAALGLAWWQQSENRRAQRRATSRARYERVSALGGVMQGLYTELWDANNAAGGSNWFNYILSEFDPARFRRRLDALERTPVHEVGNWRIVTTAAAAQEAGFNALELLEQLQVQNRKHPDRLSETDCERIYELFDAVNDAMAPIVRALAYDVYEGGPIGEWKEHLDYPRELIPKHLRPPTERSVERNWRYGVIKLGLRLPSTVPERVWAALNGKSPIPEVSWRRGQRATQEGSFSAKKEESDA
ncbi:hypothetical protein [Brevundimonas sp.]|uniref:hypothetical protein n=1 Tax=Brevundimonas sp. TaxID=1871086 RepID=UPI002FC66949